MRSPLLPFHPSGQPGADEEPALRLGVSIASASLSAALDLDAPSQDATDAFSRYRLRAMGRATPFGTFAGISTGVIARRSTIRLVPRGEYRIMPLCSRKEPGSAGRSLHRNGSLYTCQGRLRYYAYEAGRYIVRQASGDQLPDVWARGCWQDSKDARTIFGAPAGFDPKTLDAAVDELCRAEVLGSPAAIHTPADLAAQSLRSAVEVPSLPPEQQVDLHKPVETATLSAGLVRNLCDGMEILSRLAPAREPAALRIARQRFLDRFGGAQVQLMRALDNDVGIAFARLLAQNNGAEPPPGIPPQRVDGISDWRSEATVTVAGPESIQLPDDMLARLKSDAGGSFGATFAVNVSLFLDEQGADYMILNGLVGSPGERLFSRFAQADPTISSLIGEMRRFDQAASGDVLLAEVECPVRDGSADFFVAPRRELSIYFRFPTHDAGMSVPVNDLWLAVEGGRFVLHSASLGRRIEPRVSTSHNIQYQAPPAYTFLAMLGHSSTSPDQVFGARSVLGTRPRVQFRNVILQRAGWRLAAGALARPGRRGGIDTLRQNFFLPDRLLVSGKSGQFAIDLNEAGAVDYLIDENRVRALDIAELAPDGMKPGVRSAEGGFWNEILLPLGDTRPTGDRSDKVLPIIGSDADCWTYHRIFADADMFDGLITTLEPIVREFGAVNWHFVRYREEAHELRLRTELPREAHGEYLASVAASLEACRAEERLSNWHAERFVPEWSRYMGADGFRLAASLFTLDASLWCRGKEISAASPGRVWELSSFLLSVITALCSDVRSAADTCERLYHRRNAAYRLSRDYRAALAALYRHGPANADAIVPRDVADRLHALVADHAQFLARARELPGFADFTEAVAHMACNRWFALDDRSSETAVIYILHRRAHEVRFRGSVEADRCNPAAPVR